MVELGTKAHPYKTMKSAYVEIMNFHTNSERTINLFVMEGSTIFVTVSHYFVNMTMVHMQSYAEIAASPGYARIIGLDDETKIIPPAIASKFKLLGEIIGA